MRMLEVGYKRDYPDHLKHVEAVRWWYVRIDDDGYVFARGGRVRSASNARRVLASMDTECKRDHMKTQAMKGIDLEMTPGGIIRDVTRR